MVAAAVREAVGELVGSAVRDAVGQVSGERTAATSPGSGMQNGTRAATNPSLAGSTMSPGQPHAAERAPNHRHEAIRIANDADLELFTRKLLQLFENPKTRQDLRSGRLRFQLAPGSLRAGESVRDGSPVQPTRRIECGAVTERVVKAAADAGEQLLLGRQAVLTPLGREKARALAVHIEKER